jgi:hypothetical protein
VIIKIPDFGVSGVAAFLLNSSRWKLSWLVQIWMAFGLFHARREVRTKGGIIRSRGLPKNRIR